MSADVAVLLLALLVGVTGVVGALAVRSEHDWHVPSPTSLRESLHRHRRAILQHLALTLVLVAILVAFTHFENPEELWRRIEEANGWWLLAGVGFEVLSFVGYIALFRGLFVLGLPKMGWRASAEVTLAGVVATRLFATAGAGGIALTGWALHAAGMAARETARGVASFLVILYASYFATLAVVSLLLLTGILSGAHAALAALGLLVGGGVIALALTALLVPGDLEARAKRVAAGQGRFAKLATRVSTVPAVLSEAVALAIERTRANVALLGWSLLWWIGDVAVLVVTFAAFGDVPAIGVIVFAYFLGHVGNALPIPGGVGGTEGGMIGVFVACGVDLSLAVVATLTYQVISVWLPVLPGVAGFASLRRRVRGWKAEDAAVGVPG
ncbi:MAG: flippase-like domain-containing protein [Solirubrobacteraceae bacterium]|nr:flippase-like domain-containing protein [Solirubrobacteraceae bacterium]